MSACRVLFDTHCHLDDPRFRQDAGLPPMETLLAEAAAVGVRYLLIPGVEPTEWEIQERLVRQHQGGPVRLLTSFGIHPQCVRYLDDRDLAAALTRLKQELGPQAAAIGECGLDGLESRHPGGQLERQLEVLEAHLAIAESLHKPVIMHCYRAHEHLLRHLELRGGLAAPLILHSFSGSAELVPRYRKFNAWFSFAGAITWVGARRPLQALRAVPVERLLIETDGPDQCPRLPETGLPETRSGAAGGAERRINRPSYLPYTLQAMAAVTGMAIEDLARITCDNALTLLCSSGHSLLHVPVLMEPSDGKSESLSRVLRPLKR